MTALTKQDRDGHGGDALSAGRAPGLSRRAFCAIALPAVGSSGLASSLVEKSQLGPPVPSRIWEYAYVYSYQ